VVWGMFLERAFVSIFVWAPICQDREEDPESQQLFADRVPGKTLLHQGWEGI